MSAKKPLYARLLAGTLAVIAASATAANVASVSVAETQPWDAPHGKASLAAPRAAITKVTLAQEQSSVSVRGYSVHDTALRGVVMRYQASTHGAIREPVNHLAPVPNGCARNGGTLCYDYRGGHVVYKPMRSLLPKIPGMTPQNLVIRRNRIVAQYTFK